MNYLTEKNDRRHRRNAKLLTALIALTMFTAFAYYSGFLDSSLLELFNPETPAQAGSVVKA